MEKTLDSEKFKECIVNTLTDEKSSIWGLIERICFYIEIDETCKKLLELLKNKSKDMEKNEKKAKFKKI